MAHPKLVQFFVVPSSVIVVSHVNAGLIWMEKQTQPCHKEQNDTVVHPMP